MDGRQVNMDNNENKDDEVITVKMPRGDYNVMRDMIKDRKSTNFVLGKVKVYSLAISGVAASWFFLGDKIIALFKHT